MAKRWTEEEIVEAIHKFIKIEGRHPTATDFTETPYMPNARQIERNHGGLPYFRAKHFPDSILNFTKGDARASISRDSKLNSYKFEEEFYIFLTSQYPVVQVHEQKRLRPGNIASDFFVYTTPDTGFAIDIFFAKSRLILVGILNIKFKRYRGLAVPIYFIVIGKFDQTTLNGIVSAKKIPLQDNMHLFTSEYFKQNLHQLVNG